MTTKIILMLLQSEFPPDIRLEKEIRTLSQNGYSVILMCNQYNKKNNLHFSGCTIHRITALTDSKKINKILNFPIFLNPRFIIKVISLCRKYSPDFIHAHDLPMAPLGILLGNLFGKKIIFDMHENYPEAIKFFNKKGLHNFLFKNYYLSKILEKIVLKRVHRIIVVVRENKERLIRQKVDQNKIVVVSNAVDTVSFNLSVTDYTIAKQFEGKFLLIYSGGVSPDRGLETPIKALSKIMNTIQNAFMLIIGDGPSVIPLKNLSNKSGVDNYVKFIVWPGHKNLFNYLNLARILMIPQPNNDFINTTVPHKLFEYMLIGKPILVSDAKPMKRIIEETQAGTYFNSNDPNDFAEKVIQLSKSKIDFGKNGINAVRTKYNWNNDAKKLIDLYNDLSLQ